MAKLKNTPPRELDIEDINIQDNIRKDYRDIDLLADSIEKYGQLESIGIDKDKNVIFGHRRYFAIKHLLENKGVRRQVKVELIQGDRKTLQMIENLHQSEMTASEKEQGVESLIADGMSQREVAKVLCLSESKVSDMRAAGRTRVIIEKEGVDTSELSTSAVSVLRSVPDEKKKEVAKTVIDNGGTVKEAKKAVKESVRIDMKPVNDLYEEKDFPESFCISHGEKDYYKTFRKTVEVECNRECKNKVNGYCTADKISIDVFGICGNFQEV